MFIYMLTVDGIRKIAVGENEFRVRAMCASNSKTPDRWLSDDVKLNLLGSAFCEAQYLGELK